MSCARSSKGPEVEKMVDQPEREMLSAVIDFGELVVRQVAIPRTEIVAVEAEASLLEVVQGCRPGRRHQAAGLRR